MRRDARTTQFYHEGLRLCGEARRPGSRRISDGADLHAAPSGRHVIFTATIAQDVKSEPLTRVAMTELSTGETHVLTSGPNSDKLPRFSPDGRTIAFLSDREKPGDFQVSLLDRAASAVRSISKIDGRVEHLQWSPDGAILLLRVVGPKGGPSGAEKDLPSWMPRLDPTGAHDGWRSCWTYELAADAIRGPFAHDVSIWEAAWCGDDRLIILASAGPEEGDWSSARLHIVDIGDGRRRELYAPRDQLGAPAVSPDGATVAVVEALCSDRGPIWGDLVLIDIRTGSFRRVATGGFDVSNLHWCSDGRLLTSGSRRAETVVGVYDVATGIFQDVWSSPDLTVTGDCVVGLGRSSDCALVLESFDRAPEIAVLRNGRLRTATSFDVGYGTVARSIAAVEPMTWRSAADGLEIDGWLLRPSGPPPYPTVLNVHGGPVQHYRPSFLVRRMLHVLLLLEHGCAVFLPNPRGSSGRGQAYARRVLGDPGGADAIDLLSGLDVLIERGLADPSRLGVAGVSYGGFMAAWLATQSDRFVAAVAVSPHTNQLTAELLSDAPQFMARLLVDEIGNPTGRYMRRSPALRVGRSAAPTLNICGALDRCTPAAEALQFHNAMLQAGARSVLVTYPAEGHGIRRAPAALDCAARVAAWLVEHLTAA